MCIIPTAIVCFRTTIMWGKVYKNFHVQNHIHLEGFYMQMLLESEGLWS